MGKLFWLPLVALLNISNVKNSKPESYPFVPVEMAELAVKKGYPLQDAVLGKFTGEFHTNFIVLSYQELIDWFREKKSLHICIHLDTFTRSKKPVERYIYVIRNTRTLIPLTEKWFTYDDYYEAQHNAIMDAFKLIEDVKNSDN